MVMQTLGGNFTATYCRILDAFSQTYWNKLHERCRHVQKFSRNPNWKSGQEVLTFLAETNGSVYFGEGLERFLYVKGFIVAFHKLTVIIINRDSSFTDIKNVHLTWGRYTNKNMRHSLTREHYLRP